MVATDGVHFWQFTTSPQIIHLATLESRWTALAFLSFHRGLPDTTTGTTGGRHGPAFSGLLAFGTGVNPEAHNI